MKLLRFKFKNAGTYIIETVGKYKSIQTYNITVCNLISFRSYHIVNIIEPHLNLIGVPND